MAIQTSNRAIRAPKERGELHGFGKAKDEPPLIIENAYPGSLITVSIGDQKVKLDPVKLHAATRLFAGDPTLKIRVN